MVGGDTDHGGRVLYKSTATPNTITGMEYDYMIKDHLGNVRMVLTEEVQQITYPAATLENVTFNGGTAISEESKYYSITTTNVVSQSAATGIPLYQNNNIVPNNNLYSNTAANSASLYKLDASTNTVPNKTGLGIVLKVMAGDNLNIFGNSYHKMPAGGYTVATNPLIVADIIGLFTGSMLISGKGVTTGQITGQSGFPSAVSSLLNNPPLQSSTTPRAGINWIVLDEQFKWVNGGFDVVNTASGTTGTFKNHSILNINVPKNGYIYIYCSNESQYSVFFDNLQVIHKPGAILEETHYYPFGLTMAGISSKAAGKLENKFKYNGKDLQSHEFSDGTGLELYDYGARMQDPQIGRWWVQDKFAEVYVALNPYQYAANNPIKIVDEAGHLLKDKDGNILATSNGNKIHEKTIANSGSSSIVYRYKNITVYTDAGNPVSAQMVVGFVKKSVSNGKTISTPISSVNISGDLVTSNSVKSNCFGYAFANGQAIIMEGIDNIINDEYDFTGKSTGNEVNEGLESDADIAIIYGDEFDGETFNEGFAYHIGKKDKNKKWTDKDSYTAVRRNLNSSKDVEDSPLAGPGNKERLFFKRKDSSKDNPNAVIKITDPEEIKKVLEQLIGAQ